MATIDPSIALGVKPLQLENPMNAFAQMSQIQAYQRQNELANRAVEQEDALNRAYASSMNPQTGEIDSNKLRQNIAGANLGSKLPAVEKSLLDTRKVRSEVEAKEYENKRTKLERSITDVIGFDTHDQILGSLAAKVEAGELDKPTAQQLAASVPQDPRLIPSWQIKTARRLLSAKDQLEQHFTSQDFGGGSRVISTAKYGGGPAQVVQGSQIAKTMSPSDKIAQAREDRLAAGGDLKPVPVHAQKAITGAASTLGHLDKAIAELEANPDAVGWKGLTPDIALNRMDPAGTAARASIADIGSLKIHERSGAAVTASETPRLKPFIPSISDDYETALSKLKRMREVQAAEQEVLTGTYNKEQGFRDFSAPQPTGKTPAQPAAPAAPATPATPAAPTAPKIGTIQQGYRFKGGNPADPKNWEKK